MGIDPNNHRVNHTFRRSQSPNPSGSSATSSSLVKTNKAAPPPKSPTDNDKSFDAGVSTSEEVNPSSLPDLNLDLTISVPSVSIAKVEEQHDENDKSNKNMDIDNTAPSPTLVLFR